MEGAVVASGTAGGVVIAVSLVDVVSAVVIGGVAVRVAVVSMCVVASVVGAAVIVCVVTAASGAVVSIGVTVGAVVVVFDGIGSCPVPQQVPSSFSFSPIHTQMVRVMFPFRLVALHMYKPLCARRTRISFHTATV